MTKLLVYHSRLFHNYCNELFENTQYLKEYKDMVSKTQNINRKFNVASPIQKYKIIKTNKQK